MFSLNLGKVLKVTTRWLQREIYANTWHLWEKKIDRAKENGLRHGTWRNGMKNIQFVVMQTFCIMRFFREKCPMGLEERPWGTSFWHHNIILTDTQCCTYLGYFLDNLICSVCRVGIFFWLSKAVLSDFSHLRLILIFEAILVVWCCFWKLRLFWLSISTF